MSSTISAVPCMRPSAPMIGLALSSASTWVPSLRRASPSRRIVSPACRAPTTSGSRWRSSSEIRIVTGRPMTSSARQPYRRSADGLKKRMSPLRSTPTIASSAASTIARSVATSDSAASRSVTSRTTPTMPAMAPSASRMGERTNSAWNADPSPRSIRTGIVARAALSRGRRRTVARAAARPAGSISVSTPSRPRTALSRDAEERFAAGLTSWSGSRDRPRRPRPEGRRRPPPASRARLPGPADPSLSDAA